jgi:HK97 family phage prohead protease
MPTATKALTKRPPKSTLPKSGMPAWLNERVFISTKLDLRQVEPVGTGDDALPDGVCGRITGIALTYGVPDDYGTVFLPGSLARTRAEAISRGKVKLFADHGPFTDTHVGVVRSVDDIGDTAVMTADLFDTEAGRAMKEYLEAVLASGGETGLSIGFRPIEKEWRAGDDGDMYCAFKEIALREISITPVPAVPGTTVTSVRHEPGDTSDTDLLRRALRNILASLPEREARAVFDAVYPISTDSAGADPSDTPVAPVEPLAGAAADAGRGTESATDASGDDARGSEVATMAQRLQAMRATFAH